MPRKKLGAVAGSPKGARRASVGEPAPARASPLPPIGWGGTVLRLGSGGLVLYLVIA
jgi:hypothetical protein